MVGAFLTFVLAIGDYITPQILGGNNELLMPQLIMMQIGRRGDFPLASALSLILMAVVTIAYLACAALAEDRAGLMAPPSSALSPSPMPLAIYGFIFLPVVVLVLFSLQATAFPIPPFTGPSLRWYEAVLDDPRLTSAPASIPSSSRSSPRSWPSLSASSRAWGFARFMLPRLGLLRGLITLPLTVSYLIIGMGLLVIFNAIGLPKSLLAAGIGHVVINLPLCFAIIYSQMGDHQINIERAARDLGAAEVAGAGAGHRCPCCGRRIFASFFLSMTFSWDEFVISFLLTRFDTTLAGRNLEPAALRPQSQDQCRRLAGLRRLDRAGHRPRTDRCCAGDRA